MKRNKEIIDVRDNILSKNKNKCCIETKIKKNGGPYITKLVKILHF
jgi:hypothetical protein